MSHLPDLTIAIWLLASLGIALMLFFRRRKSSVRILIPREEAMKLMVGDNIAFAGVNHEHRAIVRRILPLEEDSDVAELEVEIIA